MQPLTRRTLVRTAAGLAPTTLLLGSEFPEVEAALATERRRGGCADRARVAKLIAKDMVGKHKGRLHGVPGNYNWAKRPRIGKGNRPGRYRAINAWGQIYEDAKGSPAHNVRVACKDISAWILSKRTGRWRRVDASKDVFGHNYVEDYKGEERKNADLRYEKDGSVSATLGNGYNFHFSPNHRRVRINPKDIAGIVTLYSVRVIKDDPNGLDQRDQARYLAMAGADYWLSTNASANPGVANVDIGMGKARYLTPRWTTVTMSTIGIKKLRRSHPPICIRGR